MHVLSSPFIIRYFMLIPLLLIMVFAMSFSRNALANPSKHGKIELIKDVNFDLPIWNSETIDTIPKKDTIQEIELNDEEMQNPDINGVYTQVDQMPEFGSGEKEMFQYLIKNIKYTAYAIENGIQGTVVVKFVIDEDGRVTDPIVVSKPLADLDKEALLLVNNMPNWNPGMHEGKPVKVMKTLPIRFSLE